MVTKRLERISYVSERLNISRARAYQLVREGALKGAVRLGRQIRIDPDGVDQFIRSGGEALPGGWRKGRS